MVPSVLKHINGEEHVKSGSAIEARFGPNADEGAVQSDQASTTHEGETHRQFGIAPETSSQMGMAAGDVELLPARVQGIKGSPKQLQTERASPGGDGEQRYRGK